MRGGRSASESAVAPSGARTTRAGTRKSPVPAVGYASGIDSPTRLAKPSNGSGPSWRYERPVGSAAPEVELAERPVLEDPQDQAEATVGEVGLAVSGAPLDGHAPPGSSRWIVQRYE